MSLNCTSIYVCIMRSAIQWQPGDRKCVGQYALWCVVFGVLWRFEDLYLNQYSVCDVRSDFLTSLICGWWKLMILCARSTSSSSEQSTKCRSCSENMIIQHGRHIFWEIYHVRKGLWASFSWWCFSSADWLSTQAPVTWALQRLNFISFT